MDCACCVADWRTNYCRPQTKQRRQRPASTMPPRTGKHYMWISETAPHGVGPHARTHGQPISALHRTSTGCHSAVVNTSARNATLWRLLVLCARVLKSLLHPALVSRSPTHPPPPYLPAVSETHQSRPRSNAPHPTPQPYAKHTSHDHVPTCGLNPYRRPHWS